MRRKRVTAAILAMVMLFALIPSISVSASQADDLINVAMNELHNTDGTKYGTSGWWCAHFIVWCADQANIPTSVLPRLYNTESYRSQSNYHARGSYSPKRGDIVLLDWDFDNISDHVEIVTGVHSDGVYTIGGNTSLSSNSSVYGVETKTRYNYKSWGQILGYYEVNYGGGDDTTPPTITSLTVTNKSTSSFTVNCTANETLSRAYMIVFGPGGNSGNGFDINNINSTSFSKTINTSDYGGTGDYTVHVYVFDSAGNEGAGSTGGFTIDKINVNSFTVNNITPSSFIIRCNSNQTISRAYVIVYGPDGNSGNGFDIYNVNSTSFSRTINTGDYGGAGDYTVHVYVFDSSGNEAAASTGGFNVPSLKVNSYTVSNITDTSFVLNGSTNYSISRAYIIVYGPGGNSGQGFDIYDINGTSFSKKINISEYGGQGSYVAHLYVFDSAGNSAPSATGRFYVPQSLAPLSTSTTAARTNGAIEVQTTISNLSQSASCVAAVYDSGGKLLGQTANDVNSSTNSVTAYFTNYPNASYVKVFLWDSLKGMKPLTNGEKVTL